MARLPSCFHHQLERRFAEELCLSSTQSEWRAKKVSKLLNIPWAKEVIFQQKCVPDRASSNIEVDAV